jgi:hypothetical protein
MVDEAEPRSIYRSLELVDEATETSIGAEKEER